MFAVRSVGVRGPAPKEKLLFLDVFKGDFESFSDNRLSLSLRLSLLVGDTVA